jgi:hypothetical protein
MDGQLVSVVYGDGLVELSKTARSYTVGVAFTFQR